MRKVFTRVGVGVAGVSAFVLGTAIPAMASGVAPPSFDAHTLSDPLNSFGTALLAGLVILIGLVLVIKVPFAIVNVALKAIHKMFGRTKPNAA